MSHKYAGGCDHIHTHSDNYPIDNHTLREELTCDYNDIIGGKVDFKPRRRRIRL